MWTETYLAYILAVYRGLLQIICKWEVEKWFSSVRKGKAKAYMFRQITMDKGLICLGLRV